MESVSAHSAIDIAASPVSDAGSFLLPAPPFLFKQWTSPWTPYTPAGSHMPQVNTERTLIWSIDGGAEIQHPEYPITDIHNEGFPVIRCSASGSMYGPTFPWSPSSTSTLIETEGFLPPDSAISNEGQTDINVINLADVDTDRRNQPQEGVLMSAGLGPTHQYTRTHTTSDPSAPSISQGISSKPTAVQYLRESASRVRSQKSQKSGQYPCDICGKRFAQRQGVRRHYREIHDHPNACLYCDFKWNRRYLYWAHLKAKHRDVSDAAQDEATWTSDRVANTASSPQQQPLLTPTPEHGQRGGTETWRYPPTPPPSTVVEVAPARSPAMQHVDHEPQSLGTAEPTIKRKRKRELEDAPESELRSKLLSTEVRAQLAKDLDMPVRKVQLGFEMRCLPARGYGGNVVVGVPTDEPWGHIFPSCFPTHYDEIGRVLHPSVGAEPKPTDPTGTFPSPVGILGPDKRQNSGTGAP